MKVWKANRYLSLAVLVYYLLIIYREGIMGFRFRLVREPWNMDVDSVDRNTHYINHMIKNQASKIEWCVDILQQKVPAENQRELDIIRGASHQLLMFTSKTQEFLKTTVRASDRIRMSALIEKSLSRCEPDLKNIVISVSVDPDVILCCDSFGMEETFYNLFLNACEAMPEGGTITVAGGYRRLQWSYAVSVTDTGKGIPENRIPQIFTPFYTTKKEGVNYGLGLSFCRSILQAHNGKITVRSTLSSGTTFTLWFPLSRIRKNS